MGFPAYSETENTETTSAPQAPQRETLTPDACRVEILRTICKLTDEQVVDFYNEYFNA